MITKQQQDSISTIVASMKRTGHRCNVEPQKNGTVKVQRIGASSWALIGRGGGIRWTGKQDARP